MVEEYCRLVSKFLPDEVDKLTRRMVSLPRLRHGEREGIRDFWKTLTREMEESCECTDLSAVSDAISEAIDSYAKGRVGKAALETAGASLELRSTLKRCKLM